MGGIWRGGGGCFRKFTVYFSRKVCMKTYKYAPEIRLLRLGLAQDDFQRYSFVAT